MDHIVSPSQPPRKDFYVYVLFDWQGIPRYVGKGTGDRWEQHEKSIDSTFKNFLKDEFIEHTYIMLGEIPKIRLENLTDVEARELEVRLIEVLGTIFLCSGPLTNISMGGETGFHLFSPEQRKVNSSKAGHSSWEALTPEQRLSKMTKMREALHQKRTHEESVEIGRQAGKNSRKYISAERASQIGRMGVLAAQVNFTEEDIVIRTERIKAAGKAFAPEERRQNGKKGAAARLAKTTPEKRRIDASKAGKRSAELRRSRRLEGISSNG